MKHGIGKKQYIFAARKIISEEGLNALSIRRLATILRCNTANLYRYFADMEELIMYAALGYLRDYLSEVSELLMEEEDCIKRYFGIWECFTKHAFSNTTAFDFLFFGKHTDKLYVVMKEYYSLFPEELEGLGDLRTLFLQGDFDYRDYLLLDDCVKRGRIAERDELMLNRVSINLFRGYFERVLDRNPDPDEQAGEQRNFLDVLQYVFQPFFLTAESGAGIGKGSAKQILAD